jgi:nickel superoxide dismutase
VGLVSGALAHCEIPCGIYGDAARFDTIEEHCRTIEKSMDAINGIRGAAAKDHHDLARWTTNKEEHANKIQHIVAQYFMTQRIKPGQPHYEKKIATLHEMLIAAMKCKQTTDKQNVEKLRQLNATFRALYLGPAAK